MMFAMKHKVVIRYIVFIVQMQGSQPVIGWLNMKHGLANLQIVVRDTNIVFIHVILVYVDVMQVGYVTQLIVVLHVTMLVIVNVMVHKRMRPIVVNLIVHALKVVLRVLRVPAVHLIMQVMKQLVETRIIVRYVLTIPVVICIMRMLVTLVLIQITAMGPWVSLVIPVPAVLALQILVLLVP
jgi:hypothetical protein